MNQEIRKKILNLLDQHRIMTIATLRPDGWPQATTVGYVNEGLVLYFLCGLDSQKARIWREMIAYSHHLYVSGAHSAGNEICVAETLRVPAGSVRGISDRHVIAEGEGTADPESLALGCCDLVPDPLDPARPPRCSPIELAGAAYGGDDLIGWCAL